MVPTMDVDLPDVDINYDYAIELLITGEVKDKFKDVIISILQVDTAIAELNPNMSALATAANMDEKELLGAMSHLTEEEKKRILDVMKRAETLDKEATTRSRQITQDYTESQTRALSRQSSLDRNANPVCPICVDVEIIQDNTAAGVHAAAPLPPGTFRQNTCSECERIVCKDCGSFELNQKTKFQVWICTVCNKKKKALLTNKFQQIQGQSRERFDYEHQDTPRDHYYHKPLMQVERRSSLNIVDNQRSLHSDLQRRQSLPNSSALTPSTPETPASRAQRPNFLQISDDDYFGAATNSFSDKTSTSSGDTQRQPTASAPSRERHGLDSQNQNVPSGRNSARADELAHHSNHMTSTQNKQDGYNVNNSRRIHLIDSDRGQTSPENDTVSTHHQSLHRLHYSEKKLPASSFDSHDGSDYVSHRHRDPHRHDIANDYFLSEEEELDMIAQQSKHYSQQNNESYSGDRGDYHTLDDEDYEEDTQLHSSRSYPTHEWSPPVADLSPIEDVSSTLELEAEAEWLAYQRNGKCRMKRSSESLDSESEFLIARRPGSRGDGTRTRTLSAEIDEMIRHPSLEVVQELLSEDGSSNLATLQEQTSEDKDHDSQTSTVESGYESQSREHIASSGSQSREHITTSGPVLIKPAPPNPSPRMSTRRETEIRSVNEVKDRVSSMVGAIENPIYVSQKSGEERVGQRKNSVDFGRQPSFQDDSMTDYGTDFEDGVPVVAEGTTYNIHGGRDMFAKRSPTKSLSARNKPPIAKKPSLDKLRSRSLQRQSTLDRTGSDDGASHGTCESSLHEKENRPIPLEPNVVALSSPVKSPNSRALRPTLIELEKPLNELSETPTHISVQTGVRVKHREVQASSPPRIILSPAPVMSSAASKPIPAPRSRTDNSIISNSAPNNYLESDDEIVEIRFDDDSSTPTITQLNRNNAVSGSSNSRITASTSSTELEKTRRVNRPVTTRSNSVEADVRSANLKRSMDELHKREMSENEITKDLERQLAEIRRLEERQRNILQNTLRQVVTSVNDNTTTAQSAQSSKDEIPMDSRIDYSSLLSPSFNRKTPLNSPLMAHRNSPQSPRKLSAAGRRQDMQTINENGGYSLSEVAAMSPATSHRTLSSMASPILPTKSDFDGARGYGSRSLPNRGGNLQQTYHDMMAVGNLTGSSDPFTDKNFRLSASYTELAPNPADNMSDKNCGYFSDRESDRRKVGDDLKNYTDEARRALLQFEIEKRRKQVEENNQLRTELQRLIQSGSIPAAKYDKLRNMYRDHINRSREYLGLSNSSLSSIATSRSGRFGGYEGGYQTDSDFMSSSEQLAGNLSQSSTVERFMQSNDNLYKHQNMASKIPYSVASSTHSIAQKAPNAEEVRPQSATSPKSQEHTDCRPNANRKGDMTAMPLLDIRAPKSTSGSRPNSTCELTKIGDISRTASDASFGDPEERIIDAKLEGGKTIVKSKEKEAALKQTTGPESMPSRFNFPTKQVLITPHSGAKERGLGLVIKGGQPVPTHNGVMGAFVEEIRQGSVAAQLLGELKAGDEIVEWNGVSLRNKTDAVVQDIICHRRGEIEITVRLDKQPYKLPRHQQRSDESEKTEERIDYESQYQSSESVSGGFESPLSDKSWSKEFDESRQSTLKSRRGNSLKSPVREEHEAEINDEFARMTPQTNSPNGQKELRGEQLDRTLHDMSERLDSMERQPHTPQDEFMSDQLTLSQHGSSASASEQDFQHHESNHGYRTQPPARTHNIRANHIPNGSSTVPRSTSDVSSTLQSDRNKEKMLGDSQQTNSNRRMSHQERLKQPPPLSPRTGRHPNMPRLKECGELESMLMYDYGRRLLVVRIERAVALALHGKDRLNPFIKVHFLKNNQITEKRCTRYIEGTPNPKWEQSFTFSVEEDELNFHKIKMAAWDYFQPKQNMFIGTATIDLSRQQHVDGNLRMYKLDSDPGDRRDSATPFLPRNPRHMDSDRARMMSPPRAPHPDNNRKTPPRMQHASPHRHSNNSRHSSPHHSVHNSPMHSSSLHSTSSHRDMSSEHSNSPYRELSSHHSNNSTPHSSRHSSLTRGEDNYSQHERLLQSPRHSIQSNQMDHSDTNGVSRKTPEVNNNNNTIKSGDMRRMIHMSPQHHMRNYENY